MVFFSKFKFKINYITNASALSFENILWCDYHECVKKTYRKKNALVGYIPRIDNGYYYRK